MGELAKVYKRERPDIFAGQSDDEIEDAAARYIAEDPVTFANRFRETFNVDDDDATILGHHKKALGAKDLIARTQNEAMKTVNREQGARLRSLDSATTPFDQATRDFVAKERRSVMTPADLEGGGRTRQFMTVDEASRVGKLKGVGGKIQAQDEEGNTLGQARAGASYNPMEVEAPLLQKVWNTVTGEADALQQGLATSAAELAGYRESPLEASIRKAKEEGRDPTGPEMVRGTIASGPVRWTGYGMPELAIDVGDSIEKRSPWVADTAGKAAQGMGYVLNKAGEAIDRSQGQFWGLTGLSQDLAKENRVEAEENAQQAEENLAKGQAGVPMPMREVSAYGGDLLQAYLPTSGGYAVKAGAKGLGWLGQQALQTKAGQSLADAVGYGAKPFVSLPAALGSPTGERAVLKGAQGVAREAPETFARGVADEADEALTGWMGRHGLQPEQARQYLKIADDAWSSQEARATLDPVAMDLVNTMQPIHRRVAAMAGIADDAYNPLHPLWGQNPARQAAVLNTREAVEEQAKRLWDPQTGVPDAPRPEFTPRFDSGPVMRDKFRRAVQDAYEAGGINRVTKEALDRDLEQMNFITGMIRSAREAAGSQKNRAAEAFATVKEGLPLIKQDRPDAFVDFVTFAQRENIPLGEDWVRNMGPDMMPRGKQNIPLPLQEALRKKDMVLVSNGLDVGDAAMKRHVMNVPGADEWAGQVVPRRVAHALKEIAEPQAAPKWAKQMDDLLGLAQFNYTITRGIPGFEWRNLLNQNFRVLVDQGDDAMRARRSVGRVSNAMAGKDKALRDQAEKLLGIGRGAGRGRIAAVDELRGGKSMGLIYGIPKAGPALARGVEKGVAVSTAPGELSAAGADAFFRRVFPGLNPRWSADDATRAWHWLTQVENGVDPFIAARNTNNLMIDYADKSMAEKALKSFVPFIKYYTGAFEGAIGQALKNPRRYARFHSVMNWIENYDAAQHGDRPINAKLKSTKDVISDAPFVSGGTDPLGNEMFMALRPETLPAEGAGQIQSILNSIPEGFTGSEYAIGERGASSMLGGVTEIPSFLFPSVGQPMFPMNKDDRTAVRDNAPPTAWGEAYQAARDPMAAHNLGDNPTLSAALIAASKTPGFGRVLSPGVMGAIRPFLGMGSPMGRSEEYKNQALQRLALRYLMGLRSESVNPWDTSSQQARAYGKRRPKTVAQRSQQQKIEPLE